ncbi:glycosyltransferase [Leptospira sp. WS92.C1]
MKISIVGTNDISGGAARAMYRLHQGLLSAGSDSKIICRYKSSSDARVKQVPMYGTRQSFKNAYSNASYELIQAYIQKNRTSLSNTLFSYPYPGYDLSQNFDIQSSDIINLHWVAYFLSPVNLRSLLDLKKTLVWTLHDEWAYTGGCHYTAGCRHFMDNCSECPQIRTFHSLIPHLSLLDKLDLLSDRISIIAPSRWIYKQAKSSSLFKNSLIECIPNSIDTELYNASSRERKRKEFGFTEDTFVVLFGADSLVEKRKGFKELLEAFQYCDRDSIWNDLMNQGKIHVLLFGHSAEELKTLKIPHTNLGSISDETILSQIYSSADVFILPSLEDNLPNTMLEAFSCETPVIAFPVGGIVDVVDERTGYVADDLHPKSLALKILHSLKNEKERREKGRQGRIRMLEEYSPERQSERYLSFFKLQKDLNKNQMGFSASTYQLGPNAKKGWGAIVKEVGSPFFSLRVVVLIGKKVLFKILRVLFS